MAKLGPIRIEPDAWDDWRFEALATYAGYANPYEAFGRIGKLWAAATGAGTRVMSIPAIRVYLGPQGPEALLEAALGELADGGILLRGSARFEAWWKKHEEYAAKAAAGGRARASAKRAGGRFVGAVTNHQPQHQPEDQPDTSPPPAREPARHQVSDLLSLPDERDSRARDPSSTECGVRSVPADPAKRLAEVRAIAADHGERFARLRAALRLEVPALNLTGEGERMLLERLKQRGDTEADLGLAAADCRHVLVVREAQATKTESLKYFGPNVWRADEFAWAIARTPADFSAQARAGPGVTTADRRRKSTKL